MTDAGDEPPAETDAEWPVDLAGVTETVVTTRGPNELWNAAALGVFAGADEANAATATTWGNTRTRRNFHREGEGYVQFVDDPITFVNAALTIDEHDDPVLEHAAAWTRVAVERIDSGTENGTEWEQWRLEPLETTIKRETVPTISRGFGAVIELPSLPRDSALPATTTPNCGTDSPFFESVVERAGSPREQAALERVREHAEW